MKISELRQQYPAPKSTLAKPLPNPNEDYCVAGAYLMSSGINITFPNANILAVESFRAEGKKFDMRLLKRVSSAARNCIKENDKGNFDTAWRYLEIMQQFIREN